MKNGPKESVAPAQAGAQSPAPEQLEKLLARDLAAWREAKAAIERAKGSC